jgi:pimeloyl-ACP methyl ester carboxylesterase
MAKTASSSAALPTVYLLHGWAVDQQNQVKWQPLITALKQRGLNPVFLPLPGLTSPLNEVWGLDEYVAWVKSQLGTKPAIVAGHSFGGQIAIRLASLHPASVKKLILIDNSGKRDPSLKAVIKRKAFWVMAKIGKVFVNAGWARKLIYLLARERDYLNAPPLLKRTMSLVLDQEVTADLPQISCPTLLIWGEQDRVTPLSLGRFFAARIKNAQLRTIPDARHSPHFTHVEKVADLMADFSKESA